MKDSELEMNGLTGEAPEQTPMPGGGESGRDAMLREVFELQMGMLWLAQKAMRELTARHELHPPHLMILNLLDGRHPDMLTPHQGGLSMSDFVRSLDIPPASATAMIDRMIAQELVERGPSEQDRRVVMVRLTGRGRGVVGEINALWQQIQRDAFTVLSDDQLSAHLTLMRRLQEGYLQRFPEEEIAESMFPAGGPVRSGLSGSTSSSAPNFSDPGFSNEENI
ncbi:MarR family winged helix-turn-helix transcriptional regulator [Deinococcus radiomollis]|uniref:MarR family winged helix-turn-helix transcriptional regulator n=1 Tax=Deinococcus radiomollis TaxID=468916 RepID=UPI003891A971